MLLRKGKFMNEKDCFPVKTFMPPDLDDRNDLMTPLCSKIRYNKKKLTFL